jgi:hypothetical protein
MKAGSFAMRAVNVCCPMVKQVQKSFEFGVNKKFL